MELPPTRAFLQVHPPAKRKRLLACSKAESFFSWATICGELGGTAAFLAGSVVALTSRRASPCGVASTNRRTVARSWSISCCWEVRASRRARTCSSVVGPASLLPGAGAFVACAQRTPARPRVADKVTTHFVGRIRVSSVDISIGGLLANCTSRIESVAVPEVSASTTGRYPHGRLQAEPAYSTRTTSPTSSL